MKRGIIALILVAAIGALSFFTSNEVIKRADELKTTAQAACENEEQIVPMKKLWNENRVFFSLFVSHLHLEPIDLRLNSIDYVSRDEISESCAEIVAFAEEIGELVKPSFYNIF